jgi:excinuclease UvrABC nuclease subunit
MVEVSAILGAGVYALVRDGVVVYVGQSKRMLSRISAHKSNWGRRTPSWLPASCRGILFDEVHVMPCRVEDLDRLEQRLINLWKPRYNVQLKAPTPVGLMEYISVPKAQTKFERRI